MNRDDIRQHLLEYLKQSLRLNPLNPGSIELGAYVIICRRSTPILPFRPLNASPVNFCRSS
jgi:hypothetical protein